MVPRWNTWIQRLIGTMSIKNVHNRNRSNVHITTSLSPFTTAHPSSEQIRAHASPALSTESNTIIVNHAVQPMDWSSMVKGDIQDRINFELLQSKVIAFQIAVPDSYGCTNRRTPSKYWRSYGCTDRRTPLKYWCSYGCTDRCTP